MICKPYKSCNQFQISQGFGVNPQPYQPTGHTGVDFVSDMGTPLVAPELCKVMTIIDLPEKLDPTLAPLERGFGIVMQSVINPTTYYLYWHCLPFFPVNVGDTVTQGQIVARMGDSGFCMVRGVVVPLNLRSVPPYLGTHLHAERYEMVNNIRTLTDITKFIDWSIPVNYNPLVSMGVILNKMMSWLKNNK